MKKRLLILLPFLLIASTCLSQTGLIERYWFSEDQVREMYRIIIERDYLQAENESLNDIIVYCDSINESNEDAKNELTIQLGLKDQQINNSELMYDQEHEKYLIAEETIKGLRLKKNTFAVSGVVILVGSVILLVK